MTLPDEERRAVKAAGAFLFELMQSRGSWKTIGSIRDQAARITRHYPADYKVDKLYDKHGHYATCAACGKGLNSVPRGLCQDCEDREGGAAW